MAVEGVFKRVKNIGLSVGGTQTAASHADRTQSLLLEVGGDSFVIYVMRRQEDGLDEMLKIIDTQAVTCRFYEKIIKTHPFCASILPSQAAVIVCCM